MAIGLEGVIGSDYCPSWMAMSGVRVLALPPSKAERMLSAAGGPHMITMATCDTNDFDDK